MLSNHRSLALERIRTSDLYTLQQSHPLDLMGDLTRRLNEEHCCIAAYVEPLLPWLVVSRPLDGQPPTIDLAVGYRRDNSSPILATFLSRIDTLIPAGPAGIRRES